MVGGERWRSACWWWSSSRAFEVLESVDSTECGQRVRSAVATGSVEEGVERVGDDVCCGVDVVGVDVLPG
jgi:hypothetical protein